MPKSPLKCSLGFSNTYFFLSALTFHTNGYFINSIQCIDRLTFKDPTSQWTASSSTLPPPPPPAPSPTMYPATLPPLSHPSVGSNPFLRYSAVPSTTTFQPRKSQLSAGGRDIGMLYLNIEIDSHKTFSADVTLRLTGFVMV